VPYYQRGLGEVRTGQHKHKIATAPGFAEVSSQVSFPQLCAVKASLCSLVLRQSMPNYGTSRHALSAQREPRFDWSTFSLIVRTKRTTSRKGNHYSSHVNNLNIDSHLQDCSPVSLQHTSGMLLKICTDLWILFQSAPTKLSCVPTLRARCT
jgi:hypothetical protein